MDLTSQPLSTLGARTRALPLREVLARLLIGRSTHPFVQFVRYGLVGVVCATADLLILFALTEYLHVPYLVSAACSFIVGTVLNYALSIAWVFRSSGHVGTEFTLFAIIGVGGLVINEFVIWTAVSLGTTYIVGKLIALVVGVFWNFILRRAMFVLLARRESAKHPQHAVAGALAD